jgi:glycosyltransferase involved in cell wall biosynthesis
LKSLINQLKPDLIHTQGIRADSLLASLKTVTPWALTAHNFVFDDYLMKFGKLRGFLLALKHISSQKKCENVVACSKSIQKQLLSKGIKSHAIQNGVSFQSLVLNKFDFRDLEPPIFITVNNLVRRKNTKLLIEAFCLWKSQSNANGSLVILGDGEERPYLEKISCGAIHFMGNVPNVVDYLASADYFMSASLAEGLPYTVLEALASGLPVILSDIPPHMEIHDESRGGARIFKLTDGVAGLIRELNQVSVNFEADANEDVQRVATEVFSAELMATRYQEYYSRLLKATEFG